MRVNSGIYARVQPDPTLFHVRPHKGGWCVAADGQLRALSVHASKDDAIALASSLARRGACVRIHESDGSSRELQPLRSTG